MNNLEELLTIARKIEMPDWATHAAIRKDASKAEAAAWIESAQCYVDEDPSKISRHDWAGSYKSIYWAFISKELLST